MDLCIFPSLALNGTCKKGNTALFRSIMSLMILLIMKRNARFHSHFLALFLIRPHADTLQYSHSVHWTTGYIVDKATV